eukprot:1163300-Prymnesium_polylepis.3
MANEPTTTLHSPAGGAKGGRAGGPPGACLSMRCLTTLLVRRRAAWCIQRWPCTRSARATRSKDKNADTARDGLYCNMADDAPCGGNWRWRCSEARGHTNRLGARPLRGTPICRTCRPYQRAGPDSDGQPPSFVRASHACHVRVPRPRS